MKTIWFLTLALNIALVMSLIGEAMAVVNYEDLEFSVGDSWEFRNTDESGMNMAFSVEVTGEDKVQIDGIEYEVFIARGSGSIEEVGDIGSYELVLGSSNLEVTYYDAKNYNEGARKTIFEMSFQLQDTSDGTVYTFASYSENTETIISGSRPYEISPGVTWSLTIKEVEAETTLFSGGYIGDGEPETIWTNRTKTINYECIGMKSVTVTAGTFETYEIKKTTLGEQGNYTLLYLSSTVKRDVKSVDYNTQGEILSILELLSYDIKTIKNEDTPGFETVSILLGLTTVLIIIHSRKKFG